jgi:hypothetical protein
MSHAKHYNNNENCQRYAQRNQPLEQQYHKNTNMHFVLLIIIHNL